MLHGELFYEVQKSELVKHFEERAEFYASRAKEFRGSLEGEDAEEAAQAYRWKATHLPAMNSSFLISSREACQLEFIANDELETI